MARAAGCAVWSPFWRNVSAEAVIAAAISADQVLVANDKSASAVLVNTASGYASLAGSHVNTASGYASLAGTRANDASGYSSLASSKVNDASGFSSLAGSYAASASAHDTAAAASASAAAASASAAANVVGGLVFAFDNSTTAADPGAGEFRLNNATPGSATALYIDNVDNQANSVTGWLDSWDDSTNTNKGLVLLKGLDEAGAFLLARVTAIVDSTGYRTATISVLASAGSFVLGDRFMVTFVPAGDKGSDGVGAGDVLGAGNGSTGKFAEWVNGSTITAGSISSTDIVNFDSAVDVRVNLATLGDIGGFDSRVDSIYASHEATKGDIFLASGNDYLSPRAVQSARDVVTITPRSGVATMDLGSGTNFVWYPNANVTLALAREKVGQAGMLEIIRSGSEAVTFLTAFDAGNVALSGTDYVLGYYVLSAGDVMILPGGPHV